MKRPEWKPWYGWLILLCCTVAPILFVVTGFPLFVLFSLVGGLIMVVPGLLALAWLVWYQIDNAREGREYKELTRNAIMIGSRYADGSEFWSQTRPDGYELWDEAIKRARTVSVSARVR